MPAADTPVSLRTRLKQLVPIVGVFAPLIVFWAIYYQQNSTWVTQGAMMDCYLGRLHVPPGKKFQMITISFVAGIKVNVV